MTQDEQQTQQQFDKRETNVIWIKVLKQQLLRSQHVTVGYS